MKSSILMRMMLASILFTLFFGVALAAKENMTMSANESMSANITSDNIPLSVIVIKQDNKTMTMLDNESISNNMTMPMNMPMPMMPMSMSTRSTDAPMNIVVLQNVTVNIITIMPPNMIAA